jgi:hypothetical protein
MSDKLVAPAGSPFATFTIGAVITRFGELAIRVHHGTFDTPCPGWFTPTEREDQGACHRNGFSVYWQVALNEAAREAAHPFLNTVAATAIRIQQLAFF